MSKRKLKVVEHAARDTDNPPLDDVTLARMRPAREVVPEIVKEAAKIGRPKSEYPKEAIKLRLDHDVLAHFRATGSGWQTRINDTLRRATRIKPPARSVQRRVKR